MEYLSIFIFIFSFSRNSCGRGRTDWMQDVEDCVHCAHSTASAMPTVVKPNAKFVFDIMNNKLNECIARAMDWCSNVRIIRKLHKLITLSSSSCAHTHARLAFGSTSP